MQSANPLRQFFRQPGIYLRLPSNGKHWPPGTLDLPVSNELPVYPMTAIDEITYRTPDALYNGQAVVNVIKSCIPNIIDPWSIPSIDIDAILIAIRIASYGHEMNINTTCPACSTEAEYTLDLRIVMDQLRSADYSKSILQNDLEIHFRPLNYKHLTDNSLRQFEEQKVLNILPDTEMPESEKMQRLNQAVLKLTDLTIQTLAMSISVIKIGQDTMVTEPEYIIEFLQNCDTQKFTQIRDHAIALREQSDIKPLDLKCTGCNHSYQQIFQLDQANFFAAAS
jgi:hypothetical protein